MTTPVILLVILILVAFWKYLLKVLLALLAVLLLVGSVVAVRYIASINVVPPNQLSLDHSATHSMIADGSLGVGTRPSITFTRNSTANRPS
jgi:glucan phosphoethanolaminetransferase (alkaline phosphatase superfamily)